MRKIITGFVFMSLLLGTSVWAQDNTNAQGASAPNAANAPSAPGADTNANSGTSTTTAEDQGHTALGAEVLAIKPEVGAMVYTNTLGARNTRGAAGLDLEFNVAGLAPQGSPIYTGIQTGIIYSHFGAAGADFWGSSTGVDTTSPGANMFLIPADVKIGWNFTDATRLSVHGGGNVTWRTVGNSANFGPSSVNPGSTWRIFPNAGADFDMAVTPNLSVMLRPDWTVTTGPVLFTAMVGIGISLG